MYIGIGYILVLDIFYRKLGIYSDIGYILPTIGDIYSDTVYILPTIGGYILILDIFCQQLADIFWYWIYSANIGGYILILDIFCQQLADIFRQQLGDICQL